MSWKAFIERPITGINPFDDLAIDAQIWREAHDHHHQHRRLHTLGAHRPGIIAGLEVVLTGKTEILIAPGVAVDASGRTVLLTEPTRLGFKEQGTCYVTLAYKLQVDPNSEVKSSGSAQHYRLIEGRQIVITKEAPGPGVVELARVSRSNAEANVKEPTNRYDPGMDELNRLHRQTAFPACFADAPVGELSWVPTTDTDIDAWRGNRAGLVNLLRAANGAGFHFDFTGLFQPKQNLPGSAFLPTVLYMSGSDGFQKFTDGQIAGLQTFLSAGGTLIGDARRDGGAWERSFRDLAGQLGAKLEPVRAGHPLLSAHHLFPGPPPGAEEKGGLWISETPSLILSSFDYGGAWQGQIPAADPAQVTGARERIRQAQEFGFNLLTWAGTRKRQTELDRLR